MADISNFTGSFRANATVDHRRLKRNRNTVSCIPCRSKKLKCDRQQPCGSCLKRGDTVACEFRANQPQPRNEENARMQAQARLQRLEEMVSSFIQTGSQAKGQRNEASEASPAQDSENSGPSTGGHLSRLGSETSYQGATSWVTILDSIQDIRGYFESEPELQEPAPMLATTGPDLVFDEIGSFTWKDVIDALPSRTVTDKLVSLYFQSKFFTVPFIHVIKFQRDYEAFWENPSATSFLWISSLFSILGMALKFGSYSGSFASLDLGNASHDKYLNRAGKCLIAGQYLKGQTYAIEALLLYVHCKFINAEDSDPTLWTLLGLATRLAQRMGYHRDPKHLSHITPFEGEMRRRTWFYIETFDLLFSFQIGMPTIIHEEECDTESPSNYIDEDFDEFDKELPPPRPETDGTQMQYYCYKSKMCRLLRRVIRHALSTTLPGYEETRKIDEDLHKLHHDIPPALRIRPIRSSAFTDHIYQIMHRLMLEILYLQSLCVLHRPYLTLNKDDSKYDYSRQMCRQAALKMLDLQLEFHQETKPGGRIHEDKYMLSTMTLHDFLLAAMILCLYLVESISKNQEDRDRELTALKTSYMIWSERKNISRDAAHASRILATILSKVSESDSNASRDINPTSQSDVSGSSPINTSPQSFAHTTTSNSNMSYYSLDDISYDFMDIEPLDNVLHNHGNLDWNLIDKYLLDRSGGAELGSY